MKKAIAVTLAAVFAAGAVGGLGAVTSGFKNWDVKTWFKKDVTQQEQPSGDKADTGSVVVGNITENGVRMSVSKSSLNAGAPVATSALESVTLTATITPEEVYDSRLDWTVAFKNPDSSWAKGKNVTDYVTVTPTSDGASTANVSCLSAFGEQIIIRAAARDNGSAWADCTVDYEKKLTGLDVQFYISGPPESFSYSNDSFTLGPYYSGGSNLRSSMHGSFSGATYSDYTIDKNFDIHVNVVFTQNGLSTGGYKFYNKEDTHHEITVSTSSTNRKSFLDVVCTDNGNGAALTYGSSACTALVNYMSAHSGESFWSFEICNDKTVLKSIPVYMASAQYKSSVNSVSLSSASIMF